MTCILFFGNFVCYVGVITLGLRLMVVCRAYDNVALNKPTHQENPAVEGDARFEASNAVDGLKSNHTWDEGQCVVSAYGKQTATWWVNLINIHSVHHITIYFRTGTEKIGFEKPLIITASPNNLRLKEGEQAVFRCQSSVPVPLRWSTSSNISLPVQVSVGDIFLTIPETRIPDSGSIKCFVVGEESRFFAIARLDIRSAGNTCRPDQKTCSNGNCVPISFICDGDNDCGDFSDERNCAGNTCGPDKKTCSNGNCVSISYICDGDNDCGDMSDEQNCPGNTCGPDQKTCSNGNCVPISYICDGDNDCGDFSDERNCETISYMPSNFLGFSVYVSNSTDRSQGTLCFKDNNFTTNSLPAVLTINCSVHGQYVIYYNERLPSTAYPDQYSMYAFNDVCEVEVYGCEQTGHHGPRFDGSCDTMRGVCEECESGYDGQQYEKESSSKHSVHHWRIMFYCILGVFCVSLTINGILIKCVHSRGRRLKKQRTNDEAQWRNGEHLYVSHNCNEYENVQQPPDEIYDTVV